MRKLELWQQQSVADLAYSASQPKALDLGSKNFWITGLLLTAELAKTDGAGPTTNQDYFWRAIQSISLIGGGRKYLAISGPDLRPLYWDARLRGSEMLRTPDMQAGSVTLIHQLPIVFSPNPIRADGKPNWFDPTVGIAPDTDVTLSITWNANTIWGTNRTIASGLLRVTIFGIIPRDPTEVPKYYPEWLGTSYQPQQQFSGLGGLVKFPVGWHYRRTCMLFLNGASPADNRTDGRSGNCISEVGFQSADERDPLFVKTWDFAQQAQQKVGGVADDNTGVPGSAAAYGVATSAIGYNPGVGILDWAERLDTSNPAYASPLLGANLEDKEQSALQLAFTVDTAVNTNVLIFHERYKRYPWA